MQNQENPYAQVIADLERKRDALTRHIEFLREQAGLSSAPALLSAEGSGAVPKGATVAESQDRPGGENPFLGMKIIDAAKIVLAERRKPMAPADILQALEKGGLMVASTNVIGSVLNRRQRDVGDVVSPKRGQWGLKEWYPGRTFGKKPKSFGEDSVSENSSEPEQPGEPPQIFRLHSSETP